MISNRTAGRTMIGVGVVGAILAVVGTITAWVFVGELHSATDESLAIAVRTLDAVDDTIDLADEVLASTIDAVDALAGTLGAVSGAFDAGTTAIDEVAALGETLVPSLEDAASATRSLANLGETIDGVLTSLSSLPVVPNYDPDSGLGDTFGRLAEAIEPIPEQLTTTASSLTDFTASASTLQTQLDALAESVASVGDDLADTDALVAQYRASVNDVRRLATDARDDLHTDVTWMRTLIVLGGITLLVGQIVPLWVGRWVLDGAE